MKNLDSFSKYKQGDFISKKNFSSLNQNNFDCRQLKASCNYGCGHKNFCPHHEINNNCPPPYYNHFNCPVCQNNESDLFWFTFGFLVGRNNYH